MQITSSGTQDRRQTQPQTLQGFQNKSLFVFTSTRSMQMLMSTCMHFPAKAFFGLSSESPRESNLPSPAHDLSYKIQSLFTLLCPTQPFSFILGCCLQAGQSTCCSAGRLFLLENPSKSPSNNPRAGFSACSLTWEPLSQSL